VRAEVKFSEGKVRERVNRERERLITTTILMTKMGQKIIL